MKIKPLGHSKYRAKIGLMPLSISDIEDLVRWGGSADRPVKDKASHGCDSVRGLESGWIQRERTGFRLES